MSRRMILPALFGLIGTAILVSLGLWQLDRMAQKAEVIQAIEARLRDAPVPLPATPDPVRDLYLPVELTGRFTSDELYLLASQKGPGPGFHIITAFQAEDGRRVLVDRGYIREAVRDIPRPVSDATVQLTGNLHWPQDADAFTPAPDQSRNLFFAREVGPMARALGTDEVLVILRNSTEDRSPAAPVPLNTADIPDNHLGYAVQWFLMALAWSGMTLFLLWRIRHNSD